MALSTLGRWRRLRAGALWKTGLLLGGLLLGFLARFNNSGLRWPARAAAEEYRPRPGQRANRLYRMRCQDCHGADGTGKDTRDFLPQIPNFSNPSWQRGHRDTQLVASIIDGKGRQMPPFGHQINRQQAQELVAYIRSFGARRAESKRDRQPAKAAKPAADDFAEKFRRLEKEFDQLQKEIEKLRKR